MKNNNYIQSDNYDRYNLPQNPEIRKHHTSRLAFNFSFLTKNVQYNLESRSKNVDKKVRLKLLEKLTALSKENKVTILGWPKNQGLESIPEEKIKISVNNEFTNSGRFNECEDDYWVFRLNDQGRVIGKINKNIFYILAIDPKFDLYKH